MKNKFNIALTIISLATFGLLISSCKKSDDDNPANTSQKLSFHIHTLVGNTSANYTSTFTDATGRKFTISDLRYYLSNIVLIKNDGSEYPLSGKVLLVNPATTGYELGDVPVGDYKGFRFILGLDSATNHSDPTTYPAGNPLAIQTPAIHWSWSSGYIFYLFEGKVDTTLAASGTPDYDFFYHVGMDGFKRTIDFSTEAFSIVSGSDKEIGLEFDMRDVLNNVDMRTENRTHTMDNMPLATKIADNWPGAIIIE